MASDTCKLVVKNEVLKAQQVLEDKARQNWGKKWGFYLNFDKICMEEAAKQGLSENKYKSIVTKRKITGVLDCDIWEITPSEWIPKKSSELVGWRADKEKSLEKFGTLYISPKLTLPYEPPYSCIILG